VTSMEVDEQGQWAAMLALNRATHSMSVLEEALVLREMVTTGVVPDPVVLAPEANIRTAWPSTTRSD